MAGLLTTEQNTSPHNLSIHVSGMLPAACLLLPAVLVVAQGMDNQSLVQSESPTLATPGELAREMEKLSMSGWQAV